MVLERLLALAVFVSPPFLHGADVCEIDAITLAAISANERHMKREPGYPYLISFNNRNDALAVKTAINQGWLDERTLDCKDVALCAEITEALTASGVTNLDLGPYQINYRFYDYPAVEYFDAEIAKERVCRILLEHAERHGWSWQTFARYHSSTPKLNERYRNKLMANVQAITKKEKY